MNWNIPRSAIWIGGVVAAVIAAVVVAVAMRSIRHEVYRNVSDGYEVTLPPAWRQRQLTLQDGRRIDVFASPNVAADQASCSIGSSEEEDWSGRTQEGINQAIADGALDEKLQSLVGTGGDATLVSSRHVSQSGMTAVIGVFSQTAMVEGRIVSMRTKVFVSASPGRVRYIHCVALEHKFADVDGQFDALIGSYRLI